MRFLLLIFLFTITNISFCQEVRVSESINMRNDYAYSIIGEIEDNILLYRDRGYNQNITCYDASLEYQWDKVLLFDDDRVVVHGMVSLDTSFLVYNSYSKDDKELLSINEYDKRANNKDSTIIAQMEKGFNSRLFRFELSENERYTLLYHATGKNFLTVLVVDNLHKKLLWTGEYDFEDLSLRRDLEKIRLDNTGDIYLLFQKNKSRFARRDIKMDLICLLKDGDTVLKSSWENGDNFIKDLDFSIDNTNNAIGVFGLFDTKGGTRSAGYFTSFLRKTDFSKKGNFDYFLFDENMFAKQKNRRKKSNTIDNLEIRDIIWRQDGGALVFCEINREITRRSGYSSYRVNSSFANSGWKDFYYEDVIILALLPNGEVEWQNTLYKKQFSQDDDGIYSSYFAFKTPSRLRLIYNDEIGRSSTVSEYIINGIGQYKRESLFNTEYEDLQIRFRDALQISSNALLAPSERNKEFRIVKISY